MLASECNHINYFDYKEHQLHKQENTQHNCYKIAETVCDKRLTDDTRVKLINSYHNKCEECYTHRELTKCRETRQKYKYKNKKDWNASEIKRVKTIKETGEVTTEIIKVKYKTKKDKHGNVTEQIRYENDVPISKSVYSGWKKFKNTSN